MKQKNLKAVKRRLAEYASNMCVVCTKNETCILPLHGKLSMMGGECPQAEMLSPADMMFWAWENIYGIPVEKLAKLRRSEHE